MKLSSYHKQMGDKVFLMEKGVDLEGRYDTLYICRASSKYPLPPIKFWGKDNIKIFGNCDYMNNYEIPDIVLACRPDYDLYEKFKSNKEYHYDAIQLFDSRGELLPRTQMADTIYKNKRSLVIDDGIWKSNKKDLLKALLLLKRKKNISFLFPISMKSIFSDEEVTNNFFDLNLSKGAKLIWNYDCDKDFRELMVQLNFRMWTQTAAKGKVRIVKDDTFNNLLMYAGIGRLSRVIVDESAARNNGMVNLEGYLKQRLIEFQESSRTDICFVEWLTEPLAIAKHMSAEKILMLKMDLGPVVAAAVHYIATCESYRGALVRWGINSLNLTKKDLEDAYDV